MAVRRFTESDTKKIAHGLTLVWMGLVIAGSLLDLIFLLPGAFIGPAAGV